MNDINDVKDKFILSTTIIVENGEESGLTCSGLGKINKNDSESKNTINEIPLLFYKLSGSPKEIIDKVIMNVINVLANSYACNNNLDSMEVIKDWMKEYELR